MWKMYAHTRVGTKTRSHQYKSLVRELWREYVIIWSQHIIQLNLVKWARNKVYWNWHHIEYINEQTRMCARTTWSSTCKTERIMPTGIFWNRVGYKTSRDCCLLVQKQAETREHFTVVTPPNQSTDSCVGERGKRDAMLQGCHSSSHDACQITHVSILAKRKTLSSCWPKLVQQ